MQRSSNRRETRDELLHSIPPTVKIRRGRLLGLFGVAAALAACITWVVTAFAFDSGTSGSVSSLQATAARVGATQQGSATFTLTRKQIEGLSTMGQQAGRRPIRWCR